MNCQWALSTALSKVPHHWLATQRPISSLQTNGAVAAIAPPLPSVGADASSRLTEPLAPSPTATAASPSPCGAVAPEAAPLPAALIAPPGNPVPAPVLTTVAVPDVAALPRFVPAPTPPRSAPVPLPAAPWL